jgi:hypothetical protein
MDDDTELDTGKPTGIDPLDSSTESYDLCGTSATITSTISATLISELGNQKLAKGCLERYADEVGDTYYASDKLTSDKLSSDKLSSVSTLEAKTIRLREEIISKTLDNIKRSMQVDLCFVLDSTGSMRRYIDATKDCILQVVNHMELTNPSLKLWVGLCCYRDHCDGDNRLQFFEFSDSYSKFKSYLSKVKATGGGDGPEDVLGGLDAAVDKMKWNHRTRIIFHMGDAPPHGTRFTSLHDSYPEGDPHGLTAESVLEKIKSAEILYHFGKITDKTDEMLNVFHSIIGEFNEFDIHTDSKDPKALTDKLFESVCSSITSSVTMTSTMERSVYERKRKELEMDKLPPDWDILPAKTGKLLHYIFPKTLADIKESKYFKDKSNLVLRKFSFKRAPKPFSSGAERYAYFALDVTRESAKKIVLKECIDIGRKANSLERYLEMIEVSTVAYFLSKEFNSVAARVGINKKVEFLKPQVLRHKDDTDVQCYTIEPKFSAEFKRFNVNKGVIKEYHSTLEAFAHFTYEHTGGYLVVYDLQGVELPGRFLLTDPAIHCTDRLRFGKTNLGKRGINECFLKNHTCGNVCQKLNLKSS